MFIQCEIIICECGNQVYVFYFHARKKLKNCSFPYKGESINFYRLCFRVFIVDIVDVDIVFIVSVFIVN